jgi:peroxiredoxin
LFRLQAQTGDSTFIQCHIEGISAGKAKLIAQLGDQNYIIDSAVVDAQGKFALQRKSPLPGGFYYFLLPGQKSFSLLIDREQKFSLKANVADMAGSMQVQGSTDTDLLYKNFRFQAKQDAELKPLGEILQKNAPNSAEHQAAKARQTQILADRKAHLEETFKTYPNTLYSKFKIAGQNPDIREFKKANGDTDTLRQLLDYRNRFWEGVDFRDERLLRTPVVANKLRRYIKELTPQRPDSIIKVADALIRRAMPHKEYFKFFTNWIALQYENGKTNVMDGEAVYVHIVQTFFKPELAFWSNKEELEGLQKHVWEMEGSLMGKKGQDVRAPNLQGQMKSIYEMKAPLVVVFMFSPDCEHCQKDAPYIQQIYEKWKTKGVDFYGISVNTTDAEWKDFIKKNGFTFTNVFDPTNRAIYGKYFVDITPELYILNKERIIVAKNLKHHQLEEVFERELKKMDKG